MSTLLGSIVGIIYIFEITIDRYNTDSVSIDLDTAYLHWTNTFPAISICMGHTSNVNTIRNFIEPFMDVNDVVKPKK